MDDLDSQLTALQRKIEAIESQIEVVVKAGDKEERDALRREKELLLIKETAIRKEKELLLSTILTDKELLLVKEKAICDERLLVLRSQQQSIETGPSELVVLVTDAVRLLKHIALASDLARQQQANKFQYTTSQATTFRDPAFKQALVAAYDAAGADDKIRCTATGKLLPSKLVTAAHLFKYCWSLDVAITMQFANINDVRNGLLLVKPVEEAFDNGFMVIEWKGLPNAVPSDGRFVMHWLGDAELKIQDFGKYPWKTNEKLPDDLQKAVRELQRNGEPLRFAHLDGQALTFTTNVRPFRRCCAFQAERAIKKAISVGRISPTWATGKDFSAHSIKTTDLAGWLEKDAACAEGLPEEGDIESGTYEGSDFSAAVD